MKVKANIFQPHSDIQKYLMHYLAGTGYPRVLWLSCGTKFGKTIGGGASIAEASTAFRGSTLRIVAPIYKQTKISWKYVQDMLPGKPFVTQNKFDMSMSINGYGNTVEFWSGKNPEDLEGGAVQSQLNDECAKLKEQVYISGRTTQTRTGGRTANISTPRGRNWFYQGFKNAQDEMERAKHEKRTPKEIALTAPTLANPSIDPREVMDAKRTLSSDMFDQYYRALFVEEGRVFPTPKIDRRIWQMPFEKDGKDEFWIHPDAGEKTIVAGADWAKKKDFTVVTVWDYSKRPYQCVGFMRMNGKRYTHQVVEVVKFLRKFHACDLLLHDQTGIGEVIEDLLSAVPDLNHRGLIFSNSNKAHMVNDLVGGMERNEILYPWWPSLLSEFETFEVEVSEIGNMKYAAEQGKHDDIVFSCCLGMQAANEHAPLGGEISFLDDVSTVLGGMSSMEEYLSEIMGIDVDEGF